MNIKLIDVYSGESKCIVEAINLLYSLLSERKPHQSISHRCMPSFEEHWEFVLSRPYAQWYLIATPPLAVGAIYLTHQREIGVGVLKCHQGQGYGKAAVEALMAKHSGRFLANINPDNERSMRFFQGLGFEPIQVTLEKSA